MQANDIPTKFPIKWAADATSDYVRNIPEDSQVSIEAGAASLQTGFPPLNFTPIPAGGVPPFGKDMNGILRQITQWAQWQAAGGPIKWDSTFATDIGGYPAGAIVASNLVAGNQFISTADDNLTDPDSSSSAGWAPYGFGTGMWQYRPTSETLNGWVKANGLTLGASGSGATGYAAADAYPLYAWHWNNFSNTLAPVSGGRGANAAADFAALKTITILNCKGLSPIGMDTMGGAASTFLSGVPATVGNATTPGSILGESLHQLLNAELPAITPSFSGSFTGISGAVNVSSTSNDWAQGSLQSITFTPGAFGAVTGALGLFTVAAVFSTGAFTPAGTIAGSVTGFGSNGSHNTVHRVMPGTIYLKL